MGLRLKLLVLLAAEVLGLGFTRCSRGSSGLAASPSSCGRSARTRACTSSSTPISSGPGRRSHGRALGVSALWWSVALLACGVLLVDHRRTLRALGLPVGAVFGRLLRLVALVDRRVLGDPLVVADAPRRVASA